MIKLKSISERFITSNTRQYSLTLRFGNCIIRHDTPQIRLHQVLSDYFKWFVTTAKEEPEIVIISIDTAEPKFNFPYIQKQPDPGKTKIKEEYFEGADRMRIIRKLLTGMHFICGTGINIALGPCLKNSNQVINFINSRYIEYNLKNGALLLHAAGIAIDGEGVGIAGFSGMGKSTLALHLLSEGFDFVSNDRLTVHQTSYGPWMNGVAKLPRINPGTVVNNPNLSPILPDDTKKTYRLMPEEELWNLEEKYDVFLDECFPNSRFHLSVPMKALFVLNWRRGDGEVSIREKHLDEAEELFPAFMKPSGLFFLPELQEQEIDFSVEAYRHGLEGCRLFEITGGIDFQKASKECARIKKEIV